MKERHVTEIPDGCTDALVLALRPKNDAVEVLKWQPVGEPKCNKQLQLLFFGLLSILDELEDAGRAKTAERLEGLFKTHTIRELVEIFRDDN